MNLEVVGSTHDRSVIKHLTELNERLIQLVREAKELLSVQHSLGGQWLDSVAAMDSWLKKVDPVLKD